MSVASFDSLLVSTANVTLVQPYYIKTLSNVSTFQIICAFYPIPSCVAET